MIVVSAVKDDIDLILRLDHSYTTDSVWQVSVSSDEEDAHLASLRVSLFPNERRMPPAFTSDALQALIFRCDYLWVVHNDFANAKGGHNVEETVIGYMGMTMQHWCQNGVLMCMGVAPSFRRKKIATQLLDAANATARQLNLRTLSCEVSTKNVPASRFLKAQNFRLCGYSDGFHNAQEIVLYFVARVR